MRFVDWDHRPAVLVGNKAFAVLRPGTAWVSVDRDDVYNTGAEQSEGVWRKRFLGKFGKLDLSESMGGSHRPRIKEDMNKTTMTGDRFIAAFLDDLSKEGLIHGSPAQYRRGYPKASDDEVQMLFDAGKKAGAVPHNLEHAKLIMSDNVFAFTGQGTKRFDAFHHWSVPDGRSYPSVAVLVMARTMVQFAAERPDHPPELMADALALEQRALDAIKAGVSELTLDLPQPTDDDADRAIEAAHTVALKILAVPYRLID